MKYNGEEKTHGQVSDSLLKQIEAKRKRDEWERQDGYGLYVNSPNYEQDRQKVFRIIMKNAIDFVMLSEGEDIKKVQ